MNVVRTSNDCPRTTGVIATGGANAAPSPVGIRVPAGCATAVSLTPRAALMAAWSCCSLTARRNATSGISAELSLR